MSFWDTPVTNITKQIVWCNAPLLEKVKIYLNWKMLLEGAHILVVYFPFLHILLLGRILEKGMCNCS